MTLCDTVQWWVGVICHADMGLTGECEGGALMIMFWIYLDSDPSAPVTPLSENPSHRQGRGPLSSRQTR